jgi:Polyketide cyclase / dehydrase and lipid transport
MALQIGIGVLALVVLLLVVISTRPASFRIARSAQVGASDAVVFSLLNDFHQWQKWSPWEKLDPSMKKTFDGPSSGQGAKYSWLGNSKAGEGRMTILDSKPNELLKIQLEFVKPFAATNQTTFKLSPSGDATKTEVQWIVEGENGFAAKAFSLFVNMDKLLGKEFEQGLANLNTAAQSAS